MRRQTFESSCQNGCVWYQVVIRLRVEDGYLSISCTVKHCSHVLTQSEHIPSWCSTHRLSVIHALQQDVVQLEGLCSSHPKHNLNPFEKVVSDVRVQLPETYNQAVLFRFFFTTEYNNKQLKVT